MGRVAPVLLKRLDDLIEGRAPWPLFLHGPAGTGKSCAALALLDYAGGEYLTANGLAERVIQSQKGRLAWHREGNGGTLWPEHLWAEWTRAPLVVLDELGTRDRVSDHHYDCVKQLLDCRHGRPLIAVANADLGTIELLYDDRIADRLAEGTVVRLEGESRRLRRD